MKNTNIKQLNKFLKTNNEKLIFFGTNFNINKSDKTCVEAENTLKYKFIIKIHIFFFKLIVPAAYLGLIMTENAKPSKSIGSHNWMNDNELRTTLKCRAL